MKKLFLLKKAYALAAMCFVSALLLFAEEKPGKTSVEHLYSYTLDNGLSVFVAENHSAPLVYIEVAVRAGAIAQTPENAGLFHLYEHMMFKGNPKYPNAQAMQTALKDMGVPNWNGTTSTDRVNYFITVPVDQLEKGLEFWSYAIREPLMNPKEFEDEKKVVISEIQGYFGQPSQQQWSYLYRTLFPEAPWTTDPCGSVEIVKNATVGQLREIQKKYYVPNNAAVFVGGDVSPEEAYRLVNKIYGSWKRGDDPWKDFTKGYAANPLSAPVYCVLPANEISPDIAQVSVYYHGPDGQFNIQDTYTADVLSRVLMDPAGPFVTTLVKNKKLSIPNSDYIGSGYQTSRSHGLLSFGGIMLNPANDLPGRAREFYETLTKKALPAVQKDKSLDSPKKRNLLLQALKDSNAYETESAEGLLSMLSYYWASATTDYYTSYSENMAKVQKKDFDSYLEEYVYSRNPVIAVSVNPAVYEQTKQEYEAAGFVVITAENAFWWSK